MWAGKESAPLTNVRDKYVTSILYIMTSKIVIKTRKVVNRYGGSIWFYMVLYGDGSIWYYKIV